MYKTETHLHVSEISPCAKIKASEMVKLYHEAGYNTIFVSDHFKQDFFDALGDIPWQDKITVFLSGFYKARTAGKKCGINVLMSAEISFAESPNHYLVYGITEDFLKAYPDLCKMTAEEFYPIAKRHNVFVVQAHPYRDGICYPTPECTDAIEVYNSNPRHQDFSDKSQKCAKENDLYVISGSDAHRPEDIGKSGIISECEIKSAQDFISFVKNGNIKIIKE